MNFNPSPNIVSTQTEAHARLREIVLRHRDTEYQETIPEYAQRGFECVQHWVQTQGKPIILDSGCGTGDSSVYLAQQHPHCCVVAIDKSAQRLGRGQLATLPDNVYFIRNDCIHLWRLMARHNWKVTSHYLLYPNPWPKPGHVRRRWHAHPVFPCLLQLGGELIMRTNWHIYAQEFSQAIRYLSGQQWPVQRYQVDEPISLHERKYHLSGHALFQVRGLCRFS